MRRKALAAIEIATASNLTVIISDIFMKKHQAFSRVMGATKSQLLVVEQPMYFNYKPGEFNWNGGHRVMGFN